MTRPTAGAAAAHTPRGLAETLGLKADSAAAIIKHIQRGLPFRSLELVAPASGLTIDALAEFIGVPARQLARRRMGRRLNPSESDRLVRVAGLVESAAALFEGDRDAARRWLNAPRRALDGQSPLSYARTELGAREVERLIGRLEHGVFS